MAMPTALCVRVKPVFKAQCTACHTAGVAGAPKFGDGAGIPRLGAGYAALLNSSLKGKNAMGPQGGGEFNDLEIDAPWCTWPMLLVANWLNQLHPPQRPQRQLQSIAAAPAAPAPAPAK